MVDVTKQEWYKEELTHEENLKELRKHFKVTYAVKISELADEQKVEYRSLKSDLEELEAELNEKKVEFYEAKQAAYVALDKKQGNQRNKLNVEWQAKEDAGFDKDFVPVEE